MVKKPILEIPSTMDLHGSAVIKKSTNLEDAIKDDFGKEGLARFREYRLELEVPIVGFKLRFEYYDTLRKGDKPRDADSYNITIGKVYRFAPERISEVCVVDPHQVRLKRASDGTDFFSVTLDLNPANENARYLDLCFDYEK